MIKVTEIFESKARTFSFEFFPPKTDKGRDKLFQTAEALAPMADFFSVTYGAGGSTSTSTLEIATELQKRFNRPVVHHYTCIKHSRGFISRALEEMRRCNIRNILAMRGDPPKDEPSYNQGPDEPKFGYELVEQIRYEHGDWFATGVPGFPEKHIQTPTKALDSRYLKIKQDVGAEFVITQLFFDNRNYYEFVERVKQVGVSMRLIPGILPITDYPKLVDFCNTCGANISQSIRDTFESIADETDATYKKGLEVVTAQCQDLLDNGAPGLHFFCLNKVEPVASIFNALTID